MEGLEHDNVRMLALDVTKDQNVKEVVQSIVAAEGHIDIVVNNAGISNSGEYRSLALSIPSGLRPAIA